MVFISDRELADYEEETVLASQAMDMGNSQEELLGKPLTTGGMWWGPRTRGVMLGFPP